MPEALSYLLQNQWELWGALTALWCVWLAARENILTWPVSLVSVALYAKVFYSSGLYSDSFLQLVFAAFQIYGWIHWSRHRGAAGSAEAISKIPGIHFLSNSARLGVLAAICISWPVWYQVVIEVKPGAFMPLWDSLTTVLSVVAIYFQAKKAIESWWLWIIADLIYIPMYLHNKLFITAIIYAIFLVLATYGLWQWMRAARQAKVH